MGIAPAHCAVFEDAVAGVEAGRAGLFGWVGLFRRRMKWQHRDERRQQSEGPTSCTHCHPPIGDLIGRGCQRAYRSTGFDHPVDLTIPG